MQTAIHGMELKSFVSGVEIQH